MQAVSAYGNIQHQQMIPISENICKVAFNMQPGPIPGVQDEVPVTLLLTPGFLV